MFRRTFLPVLVLTLVCALGAVAHAGPGGGDDEARDKVRERVRTMRTAKIIELLDLDEATATKLFPIFDKYEDQIAELQKDNGKARREIKEMLESGKVDDAKMNKLVDRILGNKEKVEKLEAERNREVRKVLPVAKVGKLILVLPEVDRATKQMIQEAVHPNRKHGGRGEDDGGF